MLVSAWALLGDIGAAESFLQPSLAEGPAVLRSTARLCRAELDYRRGRWDEVLATTDTELALIDEGWESRTATMTLAVGSYVCAGRGELDRGAQLLERAEVSSGASPQRSVPPRPRTRAGILSSSLAPRERLKLLKELGAQSRQRRQADVERPRRGRNALLWASHFGGPCRAMLE